MLAPQRDWSAANDPQLHLDETDSSSCFEVFVSLFGWLVCLLARALSSVSVVVRWTVVLFGLLIMICVWLFV